MVLRGFRYSVIQYNIEKGEKKVLAFLEEPMMKAFNYGPGETYGMKISPEGSKLYIGLSGAVPLNSVPTGTSGRSDGLGLTSFAVVHLPILRNNTNYVIISSMYE